MKKIGVFLARMQPLHNGHLALIKKMLEENEECLILIGSSDKLNTRNPIPGSFRRDILEEALKEFCPEELSKIKIVLLPDLTDESDNSHDWGFYLYSTIVKEIGQHCFTFYYSDGWEIITKWFPSFILQNNVDLRLIARNNCVSGISATTVRDLISARNPMITRVVPRAVYEKLDIIQSFIEIWKSKI